MLHLFCNKFQLNLFVINIKSANATALKTDVSFIKKIILAQNAGIEFETACGRITYLKACDFFHSKA